MDRDNLKKESMIQYIENVDKNRKFYIGEGSVGYFHLVESMM